MSQTINLTAAMFHDSNAARAWLEASRWPDGPGCPHCGATNVMRMSDGAHRAGLFHRRGCRGQFSVLTGSVMASSHLPLPKWVLAVHLMTASKKGISAHQLHRMLGITYKSAWFMAHRIRAAMASSGAGLIGGAGKVIEADECYHGKRETPVKRSRNAVRKPTKRGKGGGAAKRPVVALVERGGKARVAHMPAVTSANIRAFMDRCVDRRSRLHTDESVLYPAIGRAFASHETVNHGARECARGDVTTNTAEGFFGLFKRGFNGIYQHCSEAHFQHYLDEYSFRYNNRSRLGVADDDRAERAARAMNGKRLTYRRMTARKMALPRPPAEPAPKPPWRTTVELHKVDGVAAGCNGGIVIAGRSGGRRIDIIVPKTEVHTLLAGARRRLTGGSGTPDDTG